MTKNEVIQDCWGRFYEPSKYHYSINGWRSLHEVDDEEMYEMMQELNLEFGEHRFRPKKLQGIEDYSFDKLISVEIPKKAKNIIINDIGVLRYDEGNFNKCILPEKIGIEFTKKSKIIGFTMIDNKKYVIIKL